LHSPPPADNSRRPPPPISVVVVADFDTKSNEDDEEEEDDDEKTAESVAKSANKAKPHRKARILLLSEKERESACVNEYATRILFTPTPSLKEKRRKRPFDERVMTIEKIRIHVLILNLPQPLLRALRQSRTRSSRVRYSHRRRRRSSSCRHFLEQQQPQQKGFEGEKFVMLSIFRRNIIFSLSSAFSW
jgi:hypothetical protein